MHYKNEKMHHCISECWQCRANCQDALFNHCLIIGYEHLAEKHVKIMTDCIEICQLAADFMTRNSSIYQLICKTCAEICDACAQSCEEIGDECMTKCAQICRSCAETCREIYA